MAIILKNSKIKLSIDSNSIVGIMGSNYDKIISSFDEKNVFYLDKKNIVSNKRVDSLFNEVNEQLLKIITDFKLNESILKKRINDLSHSELKLLKYSLLLLSDKKIIVIDEPFIDLDFYNKKKITLLLNNLVKKKKTVIIGSVDSNVIYSLCKKVLFINEDNYYYSDISVFNNLEILNKYHIDIPDLVDFVLLAKKKNIKLNYSRDIRDLIKDVYRNVPQKKN